MILRLLNKIEPDDLAFKIYSIGIVDSKISPHVFSIKYLNKTIKLNVMSDLVIGKWIRFYGKEANGVIKCDFFEILDGIDINLMIKCIEKLSYNKYRI